MGVVHLAMAAMAAAGWVPRGVAGGCIVPPDLNGHANYSGVGNIIPSNAFRCVAFGIHPHPPRNSVETLFFSTELRRLE